MAFVVQRVAPWPRARTLAIPIATALIVLLAFDRLYLDVHWESDVLGGLLLGAIGLLAGAILLDRPLAGENLPLRAESPGMIMVTTRGLNEPERPGERLVLGHPAGFPSAIPPLHSLYFSP